jgi:hypothetical protein
MDRVGRTIGCLFVSVFVNMVAGALAGAIVAGPFWPFGIFIGGLFYAPPAGIIVGLIAAARGWPNRSIYAIATSEFLGTVTLGLWAGLAMRNVDPARYAFTGLIVGGAVGLIVAEMLRGQAKVNYPVCAVCGYNLTGNVSGVCPECGRMM